MSIEAFRTEITDTVRALVELNKIKLVLTTSLLAIAFGIGSSSKVGDYSYLTLSLVPFVCLYVDFQYYHGLAKIFVLARFLKEMPAETQELRLVKNYEGFVHRIRDSAAPKLFSFEAKAQIGSSVILALLCPTLGMVALRTTPNQLQETGSLAMTVILALSALTGTLAILSSYRLYCREIKSMSKVPVEQPEERRNDARVKQRRA